MRVEIPVPASPQQLLTCSQRPGLVGRDRLYLAFAANGAGGYLLWLRGNCGHSPPLQYTGSGWRPRVAEYRDAGA